MKPWSDLFLALPLPEGWLRGLLFIAFGLHLLFVLLMLGTAMLGFVFFLRSWLASESLEQPWNRHVAETHLGLKSLAVVLGVAPLLVIQVYYSEAFFTATGIYAYAWVAVIPLLIVAFLAIDAFAHRLTPSPTVHLLFGVLGLGALATVPAIFTGAMALMERPDFWARAAKGGVLTDPGFAAHWLFRYLHVLGAALVFGGVFHLYFSAKNDPARASRLGRWILAAVLAQVVIGVPLIVSLEMPLARPVITALTVGAAAAMLVIWIMRAPDPYGVWPRQGRALLVLLPVIFVAMLAARQWIQDGSLAAERTRALTARAARAEALAAMQPQAIERFKTKLRTVYDNGQTIYAGSCLPCHGQDGLGDGPAAKRLLIPAEDLSSIRAERAYVRSILTGGVPGTAMPYFTVFDRAKLDSLMAELDSRFSMLAAPDKSAPAVDEQAKSVWDKTCATCHGPDGAPNTFGRTLRPAPPDLTRYALTPVRALRVITEGYPGTVMQPYRDLPESVRHGLAALTVNLRQH